MGAEEIIIYIKFDNSTFLIAITDSSHFIHHPRFTSNFIA